MIAGVVTEYRVTIQSSCPLSGSAKTAVETGMDVDDHAVIVDLPHGSEISFTVPSRSPVTAATLAHKILQKLTPSDWRAELTNVRVYAQGMTGQQPIAFAGVPEVATLLRVSRQRVAELRTRPEFPKPVA